MPRGGNHGGEKESPAQMGDRFLATMPLDEVDNLENKLKQRFMCHVWKGEKRKEWIELYGRETRYTCSCMKEFIAGYLAGRGLV